MVQLCAEVVCSSLSTFSSAEVEIIIAVSCRVESKEGETRMKWDLSVLSDCALRVISTPSSLPPIHLFNYPHDSNLIFVCFAIRYLEGGLSQTSHFLLTNQLIWKQKKSF